MYITVHYWWECEMVQPLWRTVWQFLKKAKHRVITWPSSSIPGYLPERNENICPHKTCPQIFTATLFIIAKKWKQKCPSTDEWINKMWYIQTVEFCVSIKRKDTNTSHKTDEPWKHAKWKMTVTKDYMLYHFIYIKYPEQADLEGQKD